MAAITAAGTGANNCWCRSVRRVPSPAGWWDPLRPMTAGCSRHWSVRGRDGSRLPSPPMGDIVPAAAVGEATGHPYLADQGFNGERWQQHWRQYGAEVITIPPANVALPWSAFDQRWLRHHRQVIETVYSRLVTVFGLFRLQAHSRAGQLSRLA